MGTAIQNTDHIIKAVRKTNKHTGRDYLVFMCRVCGGKHSHGIHKDSVFGENDGHRVSHCKAQPPKKRKCAPGVYLEDYILTETHDAIEAGF